MQIELECSHIDELEHIIKKNIEYFGSRKYEVHISGVTEYR